MKVILVALTCFLASIAEGCHKNSDCASNFCDGGTFWSKGKCRDLVADGKLCLEGGDANSCISKKCICSYCGQKMKPGYKCSANSDCESNWCDGAVTIFCSGKCKKKTADGQKCGGINDGKSCASNKCICSYCGQTLMDGLPCSENADCNSGWCHGTVTVGCNGKCKSKTSDYGSCPLNIHGSGDNNNCKSGRCEKVSASRALCAPKNGFRAGTACNEDTDCDKTQSLWCKGGSFYSSGVCTQCPAKCPDGCNALFNSAGNMKCGRMTTFDHAVDLAKKIAKPLVEFIDCLSGSSQGIGCAKDVAKGFASCLDPSSPCKIKLGGKGSTCLALTNPGLSYDSKSGPLTLKGSVKPIGGISVEADITDGKINLALYGKVSVKADAVFETTVSTKMKYRKKLYLTDCIGKKCSACKDPSKKSLCKPMVLFTKAYMLGFVPVILELKLQAVAEISIDIDAKGSFKAGLSYDNDAVVAIKKAMATFDPIKGVKLDVGFESNFNKQIQKTLVVQAGVGLKGVIRIGAEITTAVNGIPITIYPAARLAAEGALQVTNSGCMTGSFSAGIGLDAGVSVGFAVPNPGQLMGTVCRALVETTCAHPAVKAVNCAIKVASKADPCKEAGGLCGQLEGEIAKLVPENLGKAFSGATTIIEAKFFAFNVTGKSYCLNGQKPFVSQTKDVMVGKLQGGGGGSAIKTCGAPGSTGVCDKGSGSARLNHCSNFALLIVIFLAFSSFM